MKPYQIELLKTVRKELLKLSEDVQKRIVAKIDGLALDPPSLEDDPIIGMCTGKISNLSERAEEVLEQGIQQRSGWTWKE